MIRLLASTVLIVFCSAILPAQLLNRQMKVESLEESAEIVNPEVSRSLIVVRSQVPDLVFDANRNIDVRPQWGGVWYVFFSPGTIRLKISAKGFEQLEIPPRNYPGNRAYVLRLVAVGFASAERSDETLIEISFQLNTDSVYSCYGDFAPTMALSRNIAYSLPKGNYKFRFIRNGYDEQTVDVALTQPESQSISLRKSTSRGAIVALPGIIIITSEPPGAEIILNGQKLGVAPYQDMLTAGNHQLELRKSLYHSDITSFVLKEGETKSISRPLKPRFGVVDITDQPENTSVYIDGKLIGPAPIASQTLESGAHSIRLNNSIYHDTTEVFQIKDGEKKSLKIRMRPAFGQLKIVTQPISGAIVYIDNKKIGTSPYVDKQISSGSYIVRVERELFSTVEEKVTINDGETTERLITLTANYATVNIRADSSDIVINGKKVAANTATANLPPGRYQITATRGENYRDDDRDVVLKKGDNLSFNLHPTARMGSVTILVEPLDTVKAIVYIDGEPKGKAPLVLPLMIGEHTIIVAKDKYANETKTVTVVENEVQKVTLSMETLEARRKRVSVRNQALERAASIERTTYVSFPPGTVRYGVRMGFGSSNVAISPLVGDAEVGGVVSFVVGAMISVAASDNSFFQIEPTYTSPSSTVAVKRWRFWSAKGIKVKKSALHF